MYKGVLYIYGFSCSGEKVDLVALRQLLSVKNVDTMIDTWLRWLTRRLLSIFGVVMCVMSILFWWLLSVAPQPNNIHIIFKQVKIHQFIYFPTRRSLTIFIRYIMYTETRDFA